jgi:hypothetical protein
MVRLFKLAAALCLLSLFAGCAQHKTTDYSAFKQSRPHSIVVLPPLNESPDTKATYSMLSQVTYPLAEAGYYVLPVALVAETFRQNGLGTPHDIHQASAAKLREIFGADAALYITVKEYGTQYRLISSATTVSASARLVDLKTGTALWTGSATASSEENGNGGGSSLTAMLTAAAINQIVNSSKDDAAYPIAGTTGLRLLSAGQPAGILYGPRSPKYETD